MNISYTYRGRKTELENDFLSPKISIKGSVTFESNQWTDGSNKNYIVTIEAHELLLTAQRCLEQLNSIAGTSYGVFSQQHNKQ